MSFDSTGVGKLRVGAILASSALVGASLIAGAGAASALPAPEAPLAAFSQGAGAKTVIVPDGVCSVQVMIGGGRGGVAVGEGTPDPEDPDAPETPGEETGFQGSGARIGATLNLQAGSFIDLNVGGDGLNNGIGGLNGGGLGGEGGHRGGGGGGYTSLSVNGDLLLLAGGGGGTGGGHTPGQGSGGDAGFGSSVLPGVSIATGTAYPGSAGGFGVDILVDSVAVTPSGGGGGTEVAGGAGGTSTLSVPDGHSYDGWAGTALQGGNGGLDGNLDTAGGGGSGLFGGGGGASTKGAGAYTGSGGGGGSSFVATANILSDVFLENNRVIDEEGHAGDAEPAFASLEWVMCDYNLEIVKNVVGNPVYEEGSTVRYAVTVTNTGEDMMAIGDTVSLLDDLAVGGTLVSVEGLNSSTPAVGEEITSAGIDLYDTVTLSEAVLDEDGSEIAPAVHGARGLAVGDSVTVVYDVVITGSTGEPITNTVAVADRNGTHEAEAVVAPAAPALSLTKSADTKQATAAGQKITYSFVVTNTGNIDLKEIEVAEGAFSGKGELPDPTCPSEALAPAESMTCTSVYTVLAADLTGADLTNTATATGATPLGAPVVSEKSSASVVTVVPAPLATTGGENHSSLLVAAIVMLVLGGAGMTLAVRRRVAASQ